MKNTSPKTQKQIDEILNRNAIPEHFEAFDIESITTGERIRLLSEEFQKRAQARQEAGIDDRIERIPGSGVYITPSMYDLPLIQNENVREIEALNTFNHVANVIQNTANTHVDYGDIIIQNSSIYKTLYDQMKQGIEQARRTQDIFDTNNTSEMRAAAYKDMVLFQAIMKCPNAQMVNSQTFTTEGGSISSGQPYIHSDPYYYTGLGQFDGNGANGIIQPVDTPDQQTIRKLTADQIDPSKYSVKQAQSCSMSIFKGNAAGADMAYHHSSGNGQYRCAVGEMYNLG